MQSKYYRNYCLTSHLLENQVPRWQFLNDFPCLKPTYFATFLTFTFGKIEWITLKVQCKTQPTPVGKNMALDFLLESNQYLFGSGLVLSERAKGRFCRSRIHFFRRNYRGMYVALFRDTSRTKATYILLLSFFWRVNEGLFRALSNFKKFFTNISVLIT